MNLAELQKKLIAAARANPPGDGVPYAFEKRVMALLAARTTSSSAGAVGARALAGGGFVPRHRPDARRLGLLQSGDLRRAPETFRRILKTRCWRRWIKTHKPNEFMESHSGHRGDFWRGRFDRRLAGELR